MHTFPFPTSNTILLTGAGFTHNFGGFLAKRMWAEIHNRYLYLSQTFEERELLKQLKDKFDYEEIYESVINDSEYTTRERETFIEAVYDAYKLLDDVISDPQNLSGVVYENPISITKIKQFLKRISGDRGEKGFFFTLNQDIFIERHMSEARPICPAIKVDYARFARPKNELTRKAFAQVSDSELEKIKKGEIFVKSSEKLLYIKLHGSYDWRDSEDERIMVIGTRKIKSIEKNPILSWYFELFKQVLSLPNRKLLIIGYGFKDKHINEAIAKSAKDCNLKIFIISPIEPEEFKFKILGINQGWNDIIWNAISGYYPVTLLDIFPHGIDTPFYMNFVENFFEK